MQQSKLRSVKLSFLGIVVGAAPGAAAVPETRSDGGGKEATPAVSDHHATALDNQFREASFGSDSAQAKFVQSKEGKLVPLLAVHKIKPGETLGSIALRYYRDASCWEDIVAANEGLNPKRLKVGALINLPRLSLTDSIPNYPVPQPPQVRQDSYTVQKGDTLSSIAEKKYNDGRVWPELARFNGIEPPYSLRAGQEIKLPTLNPSVRPGDPLPNPIQQFKLYTVQSGDTFRKIARKEYADPELALVIQEANPGVSNNSLQIGQILRLPVAGGSQASEHKESAPASGAVDPRIEQNLADRVLKLLPTETRQALCAKLSESPDRRQLYALAELAAKAGIKLTPEGINEFQEKQHLRPDGRIGAQTAQAICREISARWYMELACARIEGCLWFDQPGKVNCVGLRGYHPRYGRNPNEFNYYNDTVAFVWSDERGCMFVAEFPASTDPGVRTSKTIPDADKDGVGDPAWLIADRQYEYTPGVHRGKPGALIRVQSSVNRDLNHNGRIDDEENFESPKPGEKINIHWGPHAPTSRVGNNSFGCQVLQLSHAQFVRLVTPLYKDQERVYYSLIDMSRRPG